MLMHTASDAVPKHSGLNRPDSTLQTTWCNTQGEVPRLLNPRYALGYTPLTSRCALHNNSQDKPRKKRNPSKPRTINVHYRKHENAAPRSGLVLQTAAKAEKNPQFGPTENELTAVPNRDSMGRYYQEGTFHVNKFFQVRPISFLHIPHFYIPVLITVSPQNKKKRIVA
jgi:hypothetical protein